MNRRRLIGIAIIGLLAVAALAIARSWASGNGQVAHGEAAAARPTAYPTSSPPTSGATPSVSRSPAASPSTPTSGASNAPATNPAPAASTTPANTASEDCTIPAALLGRDIETVSQERVMALTFDAGSANTGVERILATLRSTGTPATFFLTGAFAQKYPADSRTIAASHPIGNHTQTHPDLTTLSDDAVRGEIETARSSIKAATGVDPRPYFRFPFGAVDQRVIGLVNRQCSVPFRWTSDSLGWKGTSGGMSVEAVRGRVVSGARPGGIVLFHVGANPNDGSTLDADALPGIISDLTAQGYRFVTLETVLGSAP